MASGRILAASALIICSLAEFPVATSTYCVSAADGSLTVCVDAASGLVASLAPPNAPAPWPVNASTQLGGGSSPGAAAVSQGEDGSITVVRPWAFSSSAGGAVVTDTFSVAPTSVRWHASVLGTSATPWSVPIETTVAVGGEASLSKKFWAPWDRGSDDGWTAKWVDPLQPSDVLSGGWWSGTYRLGNGRDGGDFVVAPLATVISADADASDSGVSLMLAPTDAPMDTHLYTDGANGSFTFSRAHHRISNFAAVELDADLAGHRADWRASLGWSVALWADWWEPVNSEVFATCAGTGSYSWFEGTLEQDPPYTSLAYKTNWDLSGRYFPYMGQFLPPVAPGVEWLNDQEGSQPRANITFESIGAWYRAMANANFTDLSYYNVNEYGINVVLPPEASSGPSSPPAPSAPLPTVDAAYISRLFSRVAGAALPGAREPFTCENTWLNASSCLAEAFPDAVVRKSWDEIGRRVVPSAYYSWQNAVVVDPGVEGYHSFMLEQLARHIVFEDAFAGFIVDRSDWMDVSSLQRDDGQTFIPEAANASEGRSGIGASLKISYNRVISDLRAVLNAGPTALAELRASLSPEQAARVLGNMSGSGVMMMNVLGNGRLDVYESYDGIFSEGGAVNSVGILGCTSPVILWTYDSNECCGANPGPDTYFQRHLYMGAMPMLPFPGNDHAINWDAKAAAQYVRYGAMMAAVAPKVWALHAHILAVVNGSGATAFPKANAFVVPLDDDASDAALLLSVMLADAPDGTAVLNLTAIDRVWPAAGPGASAHPLVRARARARGRAAPAPAPAAVTYVFEALWPGETAWAPLTQWSEPSGLLSVPLQVSCALVRARRVAAAEK